MLFRHFNPEGWQDVLEGEESDARHIIGERLVATRDLKERLGGMVWV